MVPMAQKIKTSANMASSWELLHQSARIAWRNYDAIGWFFLIPGLLVYLGKNYWGTLEDTGKALKFTPGSHETLGLILLCAGYLITLINFVPSLTFRLDAIDRTKAAPILSYYRHSPTTYLKVWLAAIASTAMYSLGLVCLIIPGLLILPRVIFSPYVALDNPDAGLGGILHKTNLTSKPFPVTILATYGVIFLIGNVPMLLLGYNYLSVIFFMLISYLTMFMPALRYSEIKSVRL